MTAFCGIAHAVPSQRAIQDFNKGVGYFNARNCREAVPYFDQAIERDAEFAEAYYARAVCKRESGNVTGAISDLNRALRLQPQHVDALALRGLIAYDSEQWDSAWDDFTQVLALRPDDAQALLARGTMALRREKLATARQDLKRFLHVRPNDRVSTEVRNVLASLDRGGDAPASATSAGSSQPRAGRDLAEKLKLRADPLADSFQQKVMRGEAPQAVGDIQSYRSVPNAASE